MKKTFTPPFSMLIVLLLCQAFASVQNHPSSRNEIIGKWYIHTVYYDGEPSPKEGDTTVYWFRADSTFSLTFSAAARRDTNKVSGTWIYNQKGNRVEMSFTSTVYWWYVADISKDSMILRDGYSVSPWEEELHLRRFE